VTCPLPFFQATGRTVIVTVAFLNNGPSVYTSVAQYEIVFSLTSDRTHTVCCSSPLKRRFCSLCRFFLMILYDFLQFFSTSRFFQAASLAVTVIEATQRALRYRDHCSPTYRHSKSADMRGNINMKSFACELPNESKDW
jgi:hypothetical protein